jgi:hypothetical protein
MVGADLINKGDFDKITGLCIEAMFSALDLRLTSLVSGSVDGRDSILLSATNKDRAAAFLERLKPGLFSTAIDSDSKPIGSDNKAEVRDLDPANTIVLESRNGFNIGII